MRGRDFLVVAACAIVLVAMAGFVALRLVESVPPRPADTNSMGVRFAVTVIDSCEYVTTTYNGNLCTVHAGSCHNARHRREP